MDVMTVSLILALVLFIIALFTWIGYEIYGIKRGNEKIMENFIREHKKKEEG